MRGELFHADRPDEANSHFPQILRKPLNMAYISVSRPIPPRGPRLSLVYLCRFPPFVNALIKQLLYFHIFY